MTRIVLLLVLLFPSSAFAALTYQLDVNLLPDQHKLVATASIGTGSVKNQQLELQLDARCTVVAVAQAGQELPFQFAGGKLRFQLDGAAPVSISYIGRFEDRSDQLPGHDGTPGDGIPAIISPAAIYLSSGIAWYPRIAAEQISYRVSVHTPAGVSAVTSGRRLLQQIAGEQSLSVWKIDYPLNGITLVAGHYRVFEDLAGSIPIYAYFFADSAPLAAGYLKEARRYLQLYENLFGPYPFHKFAIVENVFPTGYGLPSWTLLGSSVIQLPFIVKTSLGHEIAHSWWGNGVQVDYSQGNWCEGLTTYVADYLYKEQSSAEAAHEYRLNILRNYTSLVNPENSFPLSGFTARHDKASQAIGYGKATMLFHMVRRKIGDAKFWAGLKQMVRQHLFARVSWNDFAAVFSDISGQDLHSFFRQWLTQVDGPSLALKDVSMRQTQTGWTVSGKLVQKQPFYRLTVDLLLVTDQNRLRVQENLPDAVRTFQFQLASRPISLTADPDADLFRILAPEEIPSTINSIRGSNNLLVLRTAQNAPVPAAQQMLLAALSKPNLKAELPTESSWAELATHDLLIFGTPEGLLPEGIIHSAEDQRLRLPERTAELKDHSAIIVTRNPLNNLHHAAWFISQDPDQAVVVAGKIPHYGKYSYLLFAGAINRVKGTWAVRNSPLQVNIPPSKLQSSGQPQE